LPFLLVSIFCFLLAFKSLLDTTLSRIEALKPEPKLNVGLMLVIDSEVWVDVDVLVLVVG
jgi:hypothetical protein